MSDKWFRSTVFRGGFDTVKMQIDDEEPDGKIRGVAVATAGLAVGHDVHLDNDFIEDVATLGNEKSQGLKMRFGHPAMSSDAVGTFAGRFHEFRVVDDVVRADLELAESSRKSPNGDLKEYIQALANESPDMFGVSIVFTPGKEFQKNDDGENVFDRGLFENDRKTYVQIKSLHAADVVDEPAANTGLFSQWSSEMIAGKVADFLDMNPGVLDLIKNHPDIVEPFLARYHKQKEDTIEMDKIVLEKDGETKVEKEEVVRVVEMKVKEQTPQELFAEMKSKFGIELAVDAFEKGFTIAEASEEHIKNLTDKVNKLGTKCDTAMSAINDLEGGVEPLTAESLVELEEHLQDQQNEKLKKFSGLLPLGLAKFASSINIKK